MRLGQAAGHSAAQHGGSTPPAVAAPLPVNSHQQKPYSQYAPHTVDVQQQHRQQRQSHKLLRCHALHRQQQQQQRDQPDMGPRSSRKIKIPIPAEYLNSISSNPLDSKANSLDPESESNTLDPDSQGFQERGLLMAYLESLDPTLRQQFEEYMRRQMEQLEQKQEVGDAANYMQAVLDKAHNAGLSGDNFDADEHVGTTDAKNIMWQSLREQFASEEQSLLDSIFGPDRQSFDITGFTPDAMHRVRELSPERGAMLSNILSKMADITQSMDNLADRAADSSTHNSSSSSSRYSGSTNSNNWGSSFRRKKSARVHSKATEAAEQYWDKFLYGKMTDKVKKMLYYSDQMAKGQLTWGRPTSTHFKTIKQVYTEMVQLERSQQIEPGKLSQEDIQSAYTAINNVLNQLVSQLDTAGGDTATRSTLLYMDALFNSSSSSSSAESSSTCTQQQQQQGGVDLDKLHKLGRFLKAAENLDAFQTWLSVFSEKHPNLATADMLLLSNLGGDDWFIRPQQQQEALAAAEAAATAWQQQPSRKSSNNNSGTIQSAISGALLSYIDEDRIEALATLDADTLWFLTDLEANDYSEDVLLRWSLHPEISRKIMQGNWFDESEMSDTIRKLYQQAQVPEFMAGLNFEVRQQSAGELFRFIWVC